MFTKEQEEAQKQMQEARQALEATQKARDLARKILDAKELKALCDKEIKEATEELTEIANEHEEWFKDDNGNLKSSCNLGFAKIVWKKQSPTYSFNHKNKEIIGKFIDEYPTSIGFTFKKMDNIELEEFGIQSKSNESKLLVEKSDEEE